MDGCILSAAATATTSAAGCAESHMVGEEGMAQEEEDEELATGAESEQGATISGREGVIIG